MKHITEASNEFWTKVEPTGFCWEWTGRKSLGYGYFKGQRAHRFSYATLVGPIPAGLVIDHLCRNHGCVNPDHLEPVTARENTLRGFGPSAFQARQTHCWRGHEFTGANTYLTKTNIRQCRACAKIASDARRAEQSHKHCELCDVWIIRQSIARHNQTKGHMLRAVAALTTTEGKN